MKVSYISYDFGEYSIRLASALAAEAQVSLHLPADSAAPHRYRLNEAVRFQPFAKPRLRQPVAQLRTIYGLLRQIAAFQPDVIHLQQGHFWFNLALPFLRRYPLVITIHDPRHHMGDSGSHNTPQGLIDFGFRRADRVIVHGQQMRKMVVDELKLRPDRIHVIPHIVLGNDADQQDVPQEDNLVLFFGRIWAYKGLEYLIKAESLISAAHTSRNTKSVRFTSGGAPP